MKPVHVNEQIYCCEETAFPGWSWPAVTETLRHTQQETQSSSGLVHQNRYGNITTDKPSLEYHLREKPEKTDTQEICLGTIARQATEILLVLALSPLWAPLCLLIAALIWMEDGKFPLFFQNRVGKNGRVFRIWKFRTMIPGSEEMLRNHLLKNEHVRQEWNESCKIVRDPRITRIGKFLRRYSIDELPQIVNVLLGEMALVGPRPLPGYHHAMLSNGARKLRESILPGITGLWQVSGRSDTGTCGMEQCDFFYTMNRSLELDMRIIMKTAGAVVGGKGAY